MAPNGARMIFFWLIQTFPTFWAERISILRPLQKKCLKLHEIGPGGFFPTNPDLADILGRTDFDFENFYFLDFLDPKFPDFQVPKFWISRFPNFWISRFPDFHTAAGGRAGGGGTKSRLPSGSLVCRLTRSFAVSGYLKSTTVRKQGWG